MEKNFKKPFDKLKVFNKPKLKEPNLLREKNNHHEWYSGDPYHVGVEYLKNNNFEMAVNSLKEHLKVAPDDIPTRLGLGLSYMNLTQFNEAINEFSEVLKLESGNLDARTNLGIAYFKLGAFEKSIKELYTVHKENNSEAIKKRLANALYLLANKQFKAKFTDEALKYYLESDELENNNPNVHHQVGLCYKELGEPDKAITFFESALKSNKDSEKKWELYNLLFDIQISNGQSDEALKISSQMIAAFPENARAHFLAADIHYKNKNYDAALKKFEHAIACDNSYIQALLNIAEIYVLKKHLPKALSYYNKVLRLEPDNPIALCNLAIIKYNREEKLEAFTILSKLAISNGENNYLVHKYLGLIWLEKGDPEKAALRLQKAVTLNSSDPDIFINLGVSFHQLNVPDKASHFYTKALELVPDNLLALKNLSLLYFESHKNTEALKLFENILSLDPENRLVLKRKGHTLRRLGDFKNAIKIYQLYLKKEPKSVEVLFNLGVTYYETEALDKATEKFKSLLPVGHYYTPACFCYLSKIFEKQKDFDKALACAKKSVYVNAKYVDGFIQYGRMCLHFSQKEKALKYFEKALSLDPDNPIALTLAQPLYDESGFEDEAEEIEDETSELEYSDEIENQLSEDDFDAPVNELKQMNEPVIPLGKITEQPEGQKLLEEKVPKKPTDKFYSVNYSKVPEPDWEPEVDEGEIEELPEDF